MEYHRFDSIRFLSPGISVPFISVIGSSLFQNIPPEEIILHYDVTLKDSLVAARLQQQKRAADGPHEEEATRRPNRRFYSPSYKLTVGAYAQQTSKSAASKRFGVERRRISEWIRQRTALEDMEQKGIMTKRRGMKPLSDELDRNVWNWYRRRLKLGERPSQAVIKAKAKAIFHTAGHTSFKASTGWLNRWSARWETKDPPENLDHDCMKASTGTDVPIKPKRSQNKAAEPCTQRDTNQVANQIAVTERKFAYLCRLKQD